MDSVKFDNLQWIDVEKGPRIKRYINGNFNAIIDDTMHSFKKGDIIYIPGGVKHNALVKEGQSVLMLDF